MGQESLNLSVVVPAYNEEEGILDVLGGLKEALARAGINHEIIVVDDGSTDKTAQLARRAGVSVVSHPANAGYGHALAAGFAAARHDYVAMIDADGSYPPSELIKLLEFAPRFDMVVGARHGAHYWGAMLKFPVRLLFLWLTEYVTGQSIPDANSGLRVIRKEALNSGPILCRGFSFSTTLTLMFISSGRFVKFAAIEYRPRKGSSKIRFWRDTLRTGQVLVESVIYYNPLKLVLPFCLIPLAGSVFFFALHFCAAGGGDANLLGWGCVSLYFALLLFMSGAILESLRLTAKK